MHSIPPFKTLLAGLVLSLSFLCGASDSLQANPVPAVEKHALSHPLHFDQLTVSDGLSQNTILSIAQDPMGRLWFGTFDGLNMYDGYNFKIFRHKTEQAGSISDNMIRKVFFDSKGRLWVGTEAGLSYVDHHRNGFENFLLHAPVLDIEEVDAENIMLAAGDGLKFFDTKNMQLIPAPNEILANVSATSLAAHGDFIFIGTDEGDLFVFTRSTGDVRKLSYCPIGVSVKEVLPQGEDLLWVATEGEGLYCLHLDSHEVEHWTQDTQPALLSNHVRSLLVDRKDRLWIGSLNGLNILEEGKMTHYTSDPFSPGSLSQNSVRDIFEDNQGGIWLGTYFGGLNYWHELNNRFQLITRLPKENSLNDNVISCIVEDYDASLWIGTNSGGVNHYTPATGNFEHFKYTREKTGLESNDIKAIWLDKKTGEVYVGVHAGGLSVMDRRSGRLTSLADPIRNIYAILPRNERELWLGALSGLYLFDKVSRRLTPVRKDSDGEDIGVKAVKVLVNDMEGRLWVAGDEGVRVYDDMPGGLQKSEVCRKGILNNITFVNDIHESADRAIWLASRDGLYRCLPATSALLHYTDADGLPNNIVNGIEEDASGRLWLGTDFGLCCFNPYTGAFRNFTIEDGIQGNQFNKYAHCFTSDGQMYFGGINGLTVFHPDEMDDNPYTPEPIITSFHLFGKPVYAGDETGILDSDISSTKSLILPPGQNTFSIGYSVPNYLSCRKDAFSYTLEGFDDKWYDVGHKRSITYSNIPPGHYTFLLKAANNDGIWNELPTALQITIRPEWYRTIAARIVFILLAFVIFFFVMRFLTERAKMKNRLILDEQEKEHQEELHQTKMRFFINISHELRTPLTLILNPLQELIARENDPWKRKHLKYIDKNTHRLLHLINQLMDYRRAELGVFKLHVRPENVHKIIKENWAFYEKLAQSRKIRYTFSSELEGQHLFVDGQYLELILNNLLSNAFKYTETGHIGVHAEADSENLVLSVSDSGVGIPADKQEKIFERFYQIDEKHIGSGIGLSLVHRLVELHHGTVKIDSQEGVGSTFTVTLPQNLSVYSEEELNTNESAEGYKSAVKEVILSDDEPQEEIEPVSPDGNRSTLLVVENNDEVRHYMRNALSAQFKVKTAKNGQEALDLLQANDIDLIVTDLMMPVMSGDKFCAHVKQNIATSHIPVIMMSAKTDPKDQLEALKSGADAYIFKPFSMNVLIVRIQNMLRTAMRITGRANDSIDIAPERFSFNAMDEELLNRAVAIVEKHLDKVDFSTEEFAQEMNMSRSNLHLKLKALTGESALDFIRKVRFKEACKLLKDGRYSISEVSDKVGFSTPSYFATSFKKHMGCLPTEYVKQHK